MYNMLLCTPSMQKGVCRPQFENHRTRQMWPDVINNWTGINTEDWKKSTADVENDGSDNVTFFQWSAPL